MPQDPPRPDGTGPALDSTSILLSRAREGNTSARERLFARFLPILKRWAHGRLPARARGLADTDDLVQVTLSRALGRLPDLESREEGSFLAYLRRILLNAIREEIRRSGRRGMHGSLPEEIRDDRPSVLDEVLGRETIELYEAALARLPEEQQEAIILRLEFRYSHAQIAEALGKPTANAARMTVVRALLQLARAMEGSDGRTG